MRKIPAAIAVLSLAAVGLTGCSLPGASGCTRPGVPDQDVMDLVTVSGDFGAEPTVDVYTPFHTEETSFQDDVTGDGNAIISDAQLIDADVTLFSGETGEVLVSTVDDGRHRAGAADLALDPGLPRASATRCTAPPKAPGSSWHCRRAASRPRRPRATGSPRTSRRSPSSTSTRSTCRRPTAPSSTTPAAGSRRWCAHPTAVRASSSPTASRPTEVAIQTLIKGDGPVVTGDTPVRVHYTGVLWDDRTVFDTTWDGEPASLTLDGVVPGFAKALEGQTVGSQVMVVVPPDQGYGDKAQGSIPANSTLVFVIDILGLDDPAPAP